MPNFISSIPDVVWAALAASSITLLGVLLTNRHFSKQQRVELEHRKAEMVAEREFDMRRAVYLSAAGEITAAFKHISNLPYIDSAKHNLSEPLDGFFVATNKACLVASKETVELLNGFIAEYTKTFLRLAFQTSSIQDARITRDIQGEMYDSAQVEIKRLLQMSERFNLDLNKDERQWNIIQNNLDYHMERSRRASELKDEAWMQMNSLTAQYFTNTLPDLKHLGTLAAPVFVAIRREIGLDSDIDATIRSFEIRFEAISKELETLMKTLSDDAV